MASITIRNLDDGLKARLKARAAEHGRTVEDEAHDILRTSLDVDKSKPIGLGSSIRAKFAALGGVDLPETPREAMREPIQFEP